MEQLNISYNKWDVKHCDLLVEISYGLVSHEVICPMLFV